MAVKITNICIACGSCIDECPVEAILDESQNPNAEDIYYVQSEKCVECVGYNASPACADVCPTDGCIVWDVVTQNQVSKDEISSQMRENSAPVA